MYFISVDLGTTNIKVGCFDNDMQSLVMESVFVEYNRQGSIVEFDTEAYYENVIRTIQICLEKCHIREIEQIIFTGQAESLIVLGKDGKAIYRGISWMDNRSKNECDELKSVFDAEICYRITGQPDIITTWPITKMLWLKHNEKEIFDKAHYYVLLKDYIIYRLTGHLQGEYSIYNFSYYFDINHKRYWEEILNYVGVKTTQLPKLTAPCSIVANIKSEYAKILGLTSCPTVNCGTLDHFAGMIGTGNIKPNSISESTGTVMSIATLIDKPLFSKERIGCHCGPFENQYILLAICESGGINLEWFKRQFMMEISYEEMDIQAAARLPDRNLLFLPYINGVNSPDFNVHDSAVFFGLRHTTDRIDMFMAIMEGVAHLLTVNTALFKRKGINFESIISTGGGSKSDIWCQMKADISGTTIFVPQTSEAACLGAAIIGAVSAKLYASYEEAVQNCVQINKIFVPRQNSLLKQKHEKYKLLFSQLLPVFNS